MPSFGRERRPTMNFFPLSYFQQPLLNCRKKTRPSVKYVVLHMNHRHSNSTLQGSVQVDHLHQMAVLKNTNCLFYHLFLRADLKENICLDEYERLHFIWLLLCVAASSTSMIGNLPHMEASPGLPASSVKGHIGGTDI